MDLKNKAGIVLVIKTPPHSVWQESEGGKSGMWTNGGRKIVVMAQMRPRERREWSKGISNAVKGG